MDKGLVLTHLDLFSGIGGFALAAKWAGFTTVAFCEIDTYCQKVLQKNFAGVPVHGDIRTLDATRFRGISLVTGGFPCQDISCANPGAVGIGGAKSGLWFEALRVVQESRPLLVLLENVPFLRLRGADRVLYGLEASGYTARAFVVGAGNAGAPHIRKRVFVLAADPSRLPGLQAVPAPIAYGDSSSAAVQSWGIPGPSLPRSVWDVARPGVLGVDAGIPNRVDRAIALGNSISPQQAFAFTALAAELTHMQERSGNGIAAQTTDRHEVQLPEAHTKETLS